MEYSDSESDEENLPVFDWMINIKLFNENLEEEAICKHWKNVLILTEKANQRAALATKLGFKWANDKCNLHHNKGFFTSIKSRGVHDINQKSVLASRALEKGYSDLEKFCSLF